MLEIIFYGLCCFIATGNAPRHVVILDVTSPNLSIHGHRIQVHDAFIKVPPQYVEKDKTQWPFRPDKEGNYLFSLDHRKLTIRGAASSPDLHLDPKFTCLVPRLTAECPDFRALKPIKDVDKSASATLDLRYGNLSAAESVGGQVSSVYTVPLPQTNEPNENVTINGERDGHTVSLVLKSVSGKIEISIVNQPRDPEVIPDHFLAYYQLADGDTCCSNVPFREKLPDCPTELPNPDVKFKKGAPEVMSTVACSNSTYP
jgi:hypothetical protein